MNYSCKFDELFLNYPQCIIHMLSVAHHQPWGNFSGDEQLQTERNKKIDANVKKMNMHVMRRSD